MKSKLTLGRHVFNARTKKKWSSRLTAERCGLSAGFVSDIENSNRRPSAEALLRICRVLGLNFKQMNALRTEELQKATIERATKELRTIKAGLSRVQHRRK